MYNFSFFLKEICSLTILKLQKVYAYKPHQCIIKPGKIIFHSQPIKGQSMDNTAFFASPPNIMEKRRIKCIALGHNIEN